MTSPVSWPPQVGNMVCIFLFFYFLFFIIFLIYFFLFCFGIFVGGPLVFFILVSMPGFLILNHLP
jgi:hypothetical protein